MTNTEQVNFAGNIFRCIPIKEGAPFGEHWVEVTRKNGSTVGIGQLSNSFEGFGEAEDWIKQHLNDTEYL